MRQAKAACAEVPQFDRLRYFYGQMLHARDLQLEQAYFREKLKLHNRCLHGWGVVCGLDVTPPPPDPDCVPATDADYTRLTAAIAEKQKAREAEGADRERLDAEIEELTRRRTAVGAPSDCAPADPRTRAQIGCGLAIDCEGNELVVRQPLTIDIWSSLPPEDRRRVEGGETTSLYIGICYRECPVDPVRPVVADACGATADCTFGKLRDSVSVVVTADAERWTDDRCDPCCGAPAACECCVLLARIDDFKQGQPLAPAQVHPEARREISLRPSTRITGINWMHGGIYSPSQAADLLGTGSSTGGLEIRFSRPVRTETIVDGTVDIWVLEGGKGRAAAISNKSGVLVLPTTPLTDSLVYRDDTSEGLNDGDRVLVTLRSAFLLDECCRPVDGGHVGGRVPLLPHSPPGKATAPTVCVAPPGGAGPWTSGAGGATSFESWFWIRRP
jgi:hypothetical protein